MDVAARFCRTVAGCRRFCRGLWGAGRVGSRPACWFSWRPTCLSAAVGAARGRVPPVSTWRGSSKTAWSRPVEVDEAPVSSRNAEALDREADRRQVTILSPTSPGLRRSPNGSIPRRSARSRMRCSRRCPGDHPPRRLRGEFIGDAVLAVFGAPVAHEDDPERALDSALDMLARGAALSDAWTARLGQPVSLHIAVHTGPVVAGSLADAAGAARLRRDRRHRKHDRPPAWSGRPGTILVSEATHASHAIASPSSRPAS